MTQIAEQLLNQALQLPPAEREELAEQLYLSLHASADSPGDVEAAWNDEIARRLDDVNAGRVTLIPSEEVNHDIRKLLNRE
jgi:putative addiction module component (TIGR02574 family)